ncbi:helix-turn-helix transcriptional regulator [Mucilaginibacter sp.]|uniref:helix-turn-helix domain-containing protein n=1 Tax=Mucilaginibacter sp. TaxID=1882438 RepID=UPI0025D2DBA6|nr:helix-turn-helix transcriptional regulator [Mucilaginibacter sp.]
MEKIKAVREALNLKQNEFATALKITQSYLSALETGRKNVTNKIVEILIEKFKISPEWYYNNNGDIFNSSMGNIIGETNGENDVQLQKDYVTNPPAKEILYKGYYEENKIDFYYRHPDRQLNKLLSVSITELKQAFTDYSKLVKVSESFGAPDFIREKFPLGSNFKDYKKEFDFDFGESHNHITDKKLLKCFLLVAYESEIEGDRMAISQLINYMDMYADFYKGYTKESQFNKS